MNIGSSIMYGMGISLGGLENAVDILFNTDEHEDNDTTLSIKTKNIRKSVKYTGRTTKSTTNKEAIIEKYSLETVCKTISSTELNNYNDLIADTIDFDFNTSEDNSDTEEKEDNSNSLNENTNGFEVEEGYDEYNDLDTDYLGEEENDDAEDDSCFGEEENDDADFAEDGDCFGEEDDSCFGEEDEYNEEEDEYNEEEDEYNEEEDNSNYLDIMKEDKNILSEEDMLSEEEYNEEEEYDGEEDESDYLDDMDEDDSCFGDEEDDSCFGDEEDDSCFGDEDEDNDSFENEEDILDEEEGILDEEEDILDEEEDTQYVETISHNQESYNSYESTTQQKSSVMQYSKSSTPIRIEEGSTGNATENKNTKLNSSDLRQIDEKSKVNDIIKTESHIDNQDNACKQAFNLRKVVNNDISKKSGNSEQTTNENKPHTTDVYDSMTESKLFTLVKKFMKLKGLERSTIDLALLNKQFGEANVKRLIRKNFLIKIGKGVTTGR